MNFIVGSPSFYSAIIGFLVYHYFPPFAVMGTRTNVVLQHWWLVPSLFSHYFLFLRFLLQKPLAKFPILGGSKGVTSNLSFPKTSRYHFLDQLFGCFTFCHFLQIGRFLSIKLKDPQPPSFMVHLRRFLEVPDPFSWVAGSQVFCPFLHHWVADGTHLLSFFVFLGMLPWAVSIRTWPCCISRGSQAFRNPQVPYFTFLSGFPSNFPP